jgi:hypothetical protein
MPTIQILVINDRDMEQGKDPMLIATRELPIPSVGDILQCMVFKEDPWGFTGWMTIRVFEVRWFIGEGEQDSQIAVYGKPDSMRKPPQEYSLEGNKIIWTTNSK